MRRFPSVPSPLTNTEELFRGRRVLMAPCGPGDVSTGPSVDSAAEARRSNVQNRAIHEGRIVPFEI